MTAEEILNALASQYFVCLRNYGDRWGIAHKSFDGESIAEIFDDTLDRLIETWIALKDDISIYRDEANRCRNG